MKKVPDPKTSCAGTLALAHLATMKEDGWDIEKLSYIVAENNSHIKIYACDNTINPITKKPFEKFDSINVSMEEARKSLTYMIDKIK